MLDTFIEADNLEKCIQIDQIDTGTTIMVWGILNLIKYLYMYYILYYYYIFIKINVYHHFYFFCIKKALFYFEMLWFQRKI